jgi:hypothetical protein
MISLFLKNEELYLTQQVNKVLNINAMQKNLYLHYSHYIDITKNNDGYQLYHSKLISKFNILTLFAEREL